MEFFRNPNIHFLKYKWYFLAFSLIFSVAGVLSMVFWHGVPLGVDFRGGTLVYVKFTHPPDNGKIRADLDRVGLRDARIQRYGDPAINEVLIALDIKETSEAALDRGKNQIIQALEPANPPAGKQDLNNVGTQSIQDSLLSKDPLHLGTDAAPRYTALAQQIQALRDKTHGGAIASVDELKTAGV